MGEGVTSLPGKSSIEQELERVRQRGRWTAVLKGSAGIVLLVAAAVLFLLAIGAHRSARAELAAAEEAAESIVSQAEAQAAQTAQRALDGTQGEAARLRTEAEAEAQRLLQEAERQAAEIVESARNYADTILREAEQGNYEKGQTGIEVTIP